MVPAADLLVTVHTPGNPDGVGGFAHWVGGRMTRCFYATREHIIEDTGVPLPDEASFWEGDTEAHGIELPFRPSEMAAAAIAHWLGFRVSDEIDIPISAFAVDGRPEPRARTTTPTSYRPAATLAGGDGADDYDDYADQPNDDGDTRSNSELARGVLVSVGRGLLRGLHWLRTGSHRIGDAVRRWARSMGR